VGAKGSKRQSLAGLYRVRPLIALVLALTFALTAQMSASSDVKILDLFSDYDSYNPSGINSNYDLQRVEVGLYASDPDRLVVWLHFSNPITRSMFLSSANNSSAPWALVSMWRNKPTTLGGSLQDFRLSTNSSTQYPFDNSAISAVASGNTMSGGSRVDLSSCKPNTWSSISEGVRWIGFGISRSCAKIPDTFYIAGYVDPNTTNNEYADYDYAPDTAFYVDLKSTASPTISATPSPTKSTEKPLDVTTDDEYGEVFAYSSSGLPVRYESRSPSTCTFSYSEDVTAYFEILREGLCLIAMYQDGDDYFLAAPTQYTSFMIQLVLNTPSPKPTIAKKSTPTPTPTKKITGSVSAAKTVSTPTTKATNSSKIGGSASTQKKVTPSPTPKK
jgi:hypothetical protein